MTGLGSASKENEQKFPKEGTRARGNELVLNPWGVGRGVVRRARGQEPIHFSHCQGNGKGGVCVLCLWYLRTLIRSKVGLRAIDSGWAVAEILSLFSH